MDKEELRAKVLEKAFDLISEEVYELIGLDEGNNSYRDSVNFIQGVVSVTKDFIRILDEQQ